MEPLDDVVAVGAGHHHQDQHGLVPHDALEELPQVGSLPPAHVEEADHCPHEHQEVGHAEVGAGPTDPLQEQRAREHQHGQQDGVGHEDPEHEEDPAQGQASRSPPLAATPTMAATRMTTVQVITEGRPSGGRTSRRCPPSGRDATTGPTRSSGSGSWVGRGARSSDPSTIGFRRDDLDDLRGAPDPPRSAVWAVPQGRL